LKSFSTPKPQQISPKYVLLCERHFKILKKETVIKILKKFQGEGGGAAAAFKDWPLAKWLHSENPTDALYARAVDK
jgi:hypothetical protein